MTNILQDIDARTNLTSNSMFELLLFKLGHPENSEKRELFGINVFKVREIMVMPNIVSTTNSNPCIMGVADIRGQIIPVINLPKVVGCNPSKGLGILLVTEFARTTQAFAVEEVNEIVRLEWKHVLSAEHHGSKLVTSIARVDGATEKTRLAQVLDVEQIIRDVCPSPETENFQSDEIKLPKDSIVIAADDSPVARLMLENGLKAMNIPYHMTKTGQEAWNLLNELEATAQKEGRTIDDKVALILTDLEMPEMDGFTLTRNVKQDPRFKKIPVIIHSSLSGSTNEAHVRSVGADGYVAKFVAEELATAIRKVLVR